MIPIKHYIIDETTLQHLLLTDRILCALENHGIDNSSGYEESFKEYVEWAPPELIEAFRQEKNIAAEEEFDPFTYLMWEAKDEMKSFKEYKMDD